MLTLGIWSFGRDSSAVLVDETSIVSAIEEEKLSRSTGMGGIPRLAIARCLDQCKAKISDVQFAAFPRRLPISTLRETRFRLQRTLSGSGAAWTHSLGRNFREAAQLRQTRRLYGASTPFLFFEHHLCHAASAYYASPFDHALVLTLDESGDMRSGSLYLGEGDELRLLQPLRFPNSLGWFYSRVTQLLGLRARRDEHKVQWLSKDGKPDFAPAEPYRKEHSVDSLCVAGGLFLNVFLVRALETRSGFKNVYVQPVAGNSGAALGAALLARKSLGRPARQSLPHLYLGPGFSSSEIKSVLDNCKVIYKYPSGEEPLFAEVAQLLLRDKIVAWFQGRTEFGHRALGNRSILASPFSEYVIENVNQYIKHREDFHPFAFSAPAETVSKFFDCSPNCRFMASLGTLKLGVPAALERFAFEGRTVRVHAVERETNPRFWRLLHKFGERAPAPVLFNTSFNLFGEPLVSDPREAIRSFYCAGIDALAIGDFLVVK